MVKTKKFILANHFVGEPKSDDFALVEEELPALKEGGKIRGEKKVHEKIILDIRHVVKLKCC
jgi:hypothetical protein